MYAKPYSFRLNGKTLESDNLWRFRHNLSEII